MKAERIGGSGKIVVMDDAGREIGRTVPCDLPWDQVVMIMQRSKGPEDFMERVKARCPDDEDGSQES